MSNFSGGGVPDAPERVGKLIKPGVTRGVIASVEFVESGQNKTKGIELVIMTKPIEGLKDKDDKDGPDIGQSVQGSVLYVDLCRLLFLWVSVGVRDCAFHCFCDRDLRTDCAGWRAGIDGGYDDLGAGCVFDRVDRNGKYCRDD